jgi:hypothetical protein
MEQPRHPFVRWKQKRWCAEAALRDPPAARFLLDERIPLEDRFEVAVRVLHPADAPARTMH